jgi:predicted phosphodiesterase
MPAALTEELQGKRKSAQAAEENKRLRLEVDRLAEALDAARKSNLRIPERRPSKAAKGSFIRLILGDTHGSYAAWDAVNAMLGDAERMDVREVVHLGDGLECGGWLAQHHTLGFVPQAAYSYEDDVNAANQLLDRLQAATPNAKHYYVCGNHEWRIEREILKRTVGHYKDSKFLLDKMGPEAVLNLKARGIKYIASDLHHNQLEAKGTLQLGKCLFTHGAWLLGDNAPRRALNVLKSNVCFGNTHRIGMAIQQSAHEPLLGAWTFGCLCERVPLYMNTKPTDWAHGYGLQSVNKDGTFFTIPVPIRKGKSLLNPLAIALRAA